MGAVAEKKKLDFELFEKQHDFVTAEEPFVCFAGGVGSGKTRAGAVKTLALMVRHPGILGMATAPSFPMMRDATLRTVQDLWPEGSYTFLRGDMNLKMMNGSECLFRSTDEPEHLRGPNLGFFWMDEAALGTPNQPNAQHMAFQILQGRLRQDGMPHQGFLTTTPKGFNWVYDEFKVQRRADYRLIEVSARENPYLPPEFVRRLEEAYSGAFALQEIEGRFIIVGSTAFFVVERLTEMLADCMEPFERRGAAVSIWKPPVVGGKYVAGGDLAWGVTGAYSCLAILDWQTGEQVAEIHGRLAADDMASEVVKLCGEYNDAYAVIENNSEGVNVVNKMVAMGYGRYMFFSDWKSGKKEKPGWHTDATSRPVLLGEFEEAVRLRGVRMRCKDAVSEMMTFERGDDGKPQASGGRRSDHVFALALAWQGKSYARWLSGAPALIPASRGW